MFLPGFYACFSLIFIRWLASFLLFFGRFFGTYVMSVVVVLSSLRRSSGVFSVVSDRTFGFRFMLPGGVVFTLRLDTLTVFAGANGLGFMFTFSVLLVYIARVPRVSTDFS